MPAGQQLVQQEPKRERVGSVIDGLASQLFRRHVGEGPGQLAGDTRGRYGDGLRVGGGRPDALRDAEVHHLDVPVGAEHHVGGLHVAVDDSPRVREVQRLGHFGGDAERLVLRHPPSRQPLLQGHTVHVLGRHERPSLVIADLVDLADERMIEVRGRLGFMEEPPVRPVGQEPWQQEFQRDFAIEREILGQVHLAHAPVSKAGEDPIVGNLTQVALRGSSPATRPRLPRASGGGSLLM